MDLSDGMALPQFQHIQPSLLTRDGRPHTVAPTGAGVAWKLADFVDRRPMTIPTLDISFPRQGTGSRDSTYIPDHGSPAFRMRSGTRTLAIEKPDARGVHCYIPNRRGAARTETTPNQDLRSSDVARQQVTPKAKDRQRAVPAALEPVLRQEAADDRSTAGGRRP